MLKNSGRNLMSMHLHKKSKCFMTSKCEPISSLLLDKEVLHLQEANKN